MLNPDTINVSLPSEFSFMCLGFESALSMINTMATEKREIQRVNAGLFFQAGLEYCLRLATTGANVEQVKNEIERYTDILLCDKIMDATRAILNELHKLYKMVLSTDAKGLDRFTYDYQGQHKFVVSL